MGVMDGLLDDEDDFVDYGDLPPAIELEEVIILYRQLLARLGLASLGQCLGQGAQGAVFQVERPGGAIALKLTADVDEAVVSAHLARNPCAHVVRIHRVAGLPDTVLDPELAQWFVIERELLDPVADRDRPLLRALWDLYEEQDRLMVPTSRKMLERWQPLLSDLFAPNDVKRALWILRDIGKGARELAALGLEWSDLHDKNVMRRPSTSGRYVIADPGPGVMTGWRESRPIRIPAFRVGELPKRDDASHAAAP